jgi:hypothetical protein
MELLCTPDHHFFVKGRGFVRADTLRGGDPLFGTQGEPLMVLNTEVWAETARTYNFEVEHWHTYFVAGKEHGLAVWVHNPFRSLNEPDIVCLRAGKGLTASGTGFGQGAQAQTIAGKSTGYIPTTEVHPSELPLGDPNNYIQFDKDKVAYISKEELLKNKQLDARTRRWVEQQEHSLVKREIPLSAMEEIVIEGKPFTPPGK